MKKNRKDTRVLVEKSTPGQAPNKRVCIVTEEWPGLPGCGGIGTAFFELATLLDRSDWAVTVLFVPMGEAPTQLAGLGNIQFTVLDLKQYVYEPFSYEKKSFAVAMWLRAQAAFGSVHFCDYKGLGCAATSMKSQGIAFGSSTLCVQLHGFTRWATELNGCFFDHEDQILIDHLERTSSLNADVIVSPSQYLLDWAEARGYTSAASVKHCIPNCHVALEGRRALLPARDARAVTEIIFVGRHESRKALDVFVGAILNNADDILRRNIQVSILGSFGTVNETPSGLYLMDALGPTGISVNLITGLDRFGVIDYLCERQQALVIVPSPEENSPYTVLESLVLGIPVITSERGGARELYADDSVGEYVFEPSLSALSDKLAAILAQGARAAPVSAAVRCTHETWLALLAGIARLPAPQAQAAHDLMVTVGITHYERPDKIIDAVSSMLLQTYQNIELLVVDDGSRSDEALQTLAYVEALVSRAGGRVIRQPNGYLGAARNALIREARGELLVFLDDDNVALPHMVETLVQAIQNSGADAVTAQSIFMPLSARNEMIAKKTSLQEPVSYVPTAGPLALAPIRNVFGDASGIYRKQMLKDLGGYTELRNVGYEDYELYTRIALAGYRIASCPLPLYLYEIGRPSMLTRNSMVKDFQRVFRTVKEGAGDPRFVDLIEIGTGARVRELAYNRKHWEYSHHPDAEHMLPLLEDPDNKERYINCLLQLAIGRGYRNVVSALLLSQTPATLQVPKPRAIVAECKHSLLSIGELSALSSSCWDEDPNLFILNFAKAALTTVGTEPMVDQLLNTWLARFDSDARLVRVLSPQLLHTLAVMLRDDLASRPQFLSMFHTLALHAVKAAAPDVFKVAFGEVFSLETAEYLERYRDVGEVFGKVPAKGFMHFLRLGGKENRSGFANTFPIVKSCLADDPNAEIPMHLRTMLAKADEAALA
ncbi:glycosyltransferase [Massilia sp. IC2-476]|uniref:glycosyltransferase n=1 Tax=Massilia sp. IC2-476 TaxID=2887199 RepID=UPI001D0FA397|nr:glycosyltransferase [Massilia sp. IC2-476]MCC2970849.1 glycosyltransferase [Massilia sp. IC2-476]